MTRTPHLLLGAALTLIAAPVIARDKVEHLYGPAPTWAQYRIIAEADIARRLVDPESARITWLGQYHKGVWKPFLQGRVAGYVACGTVNARNQMGGYAGAVTFVTVIDYDRVVFAELDTRAGGMIAESCNKALAAGLLPRLPETANTTALCAAGSSPAATTSNSSGLTLRAMPDGAYITAVAPGSPAAAAALTPGMVITSVNAIPLAGMGDAMLKVMDAAGGNAALALVGGQIIKLGRKP